MRFYNVSKFFYWVIIAFLICLLVILLDHAGHAIHNAQLAEVKQKKGEPRKQQKEEIKKEEEAGKPENEEKVRNLEEETKKEQLSKPDKMHTILLWTKFFQDDNFTFGLDQAPFIGENKCPVQNCRVTKDRTLMDLEDFDVLVFHLWGENIADMLKPLNKRSPKQYYAFASVEHSDYYLIPDLMPRDFFNWTITYRQDSDFHWPYYKIVDINDTSHIIAPAKSPQWIDHHDEPFDINKFVPTLKKKHKKVAWFASRCSTTNKREIYAKELQKHIEIDIYGKCGPLKCPIEELNKCHDMLENDYYFYLAFEHGDCFDYVSERVTHALNHGTIPIVYGGANYTQFLPPHSYINAKDYKPKELAELMNKIISNHTEYSQYFWWRNYYKLYNIAIGQARTEPILHPFCEMCKALQNPNLTQKRYEDFNSWWVGSKSNPSCIH